MYFTFCSAFVLLFTLLSDNISYHVLNIQLLFINKDNPNNLQQHTRNHHKQQQRKGMIDMMFVLSCFIFVLFYLFILQPTFCSNIITVIWFDTTKFRSYLYFLIEFLKNSKLQGKLPYFYWIDCGFDFLLSWFWVHLVIDQWIKRTLCVSYITGLMLETFGNWPVNKSDTMC